MPSKSTQAGRWKVLGQLIDSSASCSQPAGDTSKDESRRMSWVGYGMDLAQLLKRRSLFSRWVTRPTGYELVMGRVKGEEVPGQ